ncbi:MAG: ATP synthase F1 subunit epsilon [Candidatus Parcubacteria bacterium]|nr:ATP synthase F1 subunit epsilon [Candidatus Parcubacteria bacterium]
MSDKKLQFKITTPEREVYNDQIDQVTIPTREGEITVLPEHIPLLAVLVPGELKIVKDKEENLMAVAGGFIEVLHDKVTILADSAELAEEINEERAEEARQRALALQKEKRYDAEEFAVLATKIQREFARLKVARKRKS